MRTVVFKLALFGSEAERSASERVLRAMLEALVLADVAWLEFHPDTPDLYGAGVRYHTEQPKVKGAPIPEEWLEIPYIRARGWGDCEDLASWLCAQYRVRQRVHAVCDFIYRRVGHFSIYHIFVRLPDGSVRDPSRVLGMKAIA